MFVIVYSFKVKPNQHREFEKVWKDLTQLIYDYAGSLGSRLHKQDDNSYIAYAQWPSEKVWKEAGSELPEASKELKEKMYNSCESIELLHELEVIDDLLKVEQRN